MTPNQPGKPRPNPFQSANVKGPITRRVKSGPGAEKKLYAPAICLLVVSCLATLLLLGSAGMDIINLASGNEIVPGNRAAEQMGATGTMIFRGVFYLIFLGYYGFIAYGSIEMTRRQNFAMAKVTAIMACIPLCTPCVVIGIPFGVWALIVLSDPKVRDRFLS